MPPGHLTSSAGLFHPLILSPWASQTDGRGDGWAKHVNSFYGTTHAGNSTPSNKIRRASSQGIGGVLFCIDQVETGA